MRIMLFPKLIISEETEVCTLKNCSLVIDANNFFYNSYRESKRPYVFGSEANEYAKYLRNKLNMFRQANIKCYFVFNGGTIGTERQEKNDSGSKKFLVTPIFLQEVVMEVLDEQKMNYVTCIKKPKEDCVALAQKLGCAVLSNNIFYCFKRTPYIQFTNLQYSWRQQSITCKQYSLKKFLDKHSLTEKKFAIFATLSDTTVFPDDHFSDLFQSLNVTGKDLYQQHKNLIKWLSENSENVILEQVCNFLSNNNDNIKFINYTEKVLAGMQSEHSGIASDYLLNDCKLQVTSSDPLWFEKGIAMQKIAVLYIDLYMHTHLEGSWTIEKKDSTDSLMVSIDIIKYACNLLTNFKSNQISIYRAGTYCMKIDTGDSNIKRPEYKCTESVFENGWENMKELKLFEHFLAENNINTNVIQKLPSEARMLFISLLYFARKKVLENIDVSKQVYCFIICYVMLDVVSDKQDSPRKKRAGINEEDCIKAITATRKYFKYINKDETQQIFDGDELKTLVELQYCLLDMNYLNVLCGSSYRATTYHRTFNGTFVYKLMHDMKNFNEIFFIRSLFNKAPSVLSFINKLITAYDGAL